MRRATLTTAVVLVGLAGCSGPKEGFERVPTYPVRGTVTHRGQPAAGAMLLFRPVGGPSMQAPAAFGVAGPDGTFTLATYTNGDGIPAGEYVVVIEWRAGGKEGGGGTASGPDKLKGKYNSAEKSNVRRTIPEGGGDLPPIDLD